VHQAERYLEEEIDSGIVVARSHDIRFWHLTFQEYLAARAVGGRGETEQRSLLLEPPLRFYSSEWREVVLLLGGVLYTQGRAKVDGLVQAVLENLHADRDPSLAQQARTAGLLGALVRDLAPFAFFSVKRGSSPMMGQLPPAHSELFYDFCLERHVPQDHLLRRIDAVLDLDGCVSTSNRAIAPRDGPRSTRTDDPHADRWLLRRSWVGRLRCSSADIPGRIWTRYRSMICARVGTVRASSAPGGV
jgi:hypothetical protein